MKTINDFRSKLAAIVHFTAEAKTSQDWLDMAESLSECCAFASNTRRAVLTLEELNGTAPVGAKAVTAEPTVRLNADGTVKRRPGRPRKNPQPEVNVAPASAPVVSTDTVPAPASSENVDVEPIVFSEIDDPDGSKSFGDVFPESFDITNPVSVLNEEAAAE